MSNEKYLHLYENDSQLSEGLASHTERYFVGYSLGSKRVTYDWTPPIQYEAVDLGLPSGLLWASSNVGSSTPEGYGEYYAWAETAPKSAYTAGNYIQGNENIGSEINPSNDAARANMGGTWRTPISTEWVELSANTNCVWTTLNGINGRRFTSKTNGNSIFIPAAGQVINELPAGNVNQFGFYWTASVTSGDTGKATNAFFQSSYISLQDNTRRYGFPIRGVKNGN